MSTLRAPNGLDLVSVRRCPHGHIVRAWYASEKDRTPVERMDVVTYRNEPWSACRECRKARRAE